VIVNELAGRPQDAEFAAAEDEAGESNPFDSRIEGERVGGESDDSMSEEINGGVPNDPFFAGIEDDFGRMDGVKGRLFPGATGADDVGEDFGWRVAGDGLVGLSVDHDAGEIEVRILARAAFGACFPGEVQIVRREEAGGIGENHMAGGFALLVLGIKGEGVGSQDLVCKGGADSLLEGDLVLGEDGGSGLDNEITINLPNICLI